LARSDVDPIHPAVRPEDPASAGGAIDEAVKNYGAGG
jgi:hypothetical protein